MDKPRDTKVRKEAEENEQSTDELDQRGCHGEEPRGVIPHPLHGALPSRKARTVPPAEDLLSAVRGECQADCELEDEKCERDRVHGSGERSSRPRPVVEGAGCLPIVTDAASTMA